MLHVREFVKFDFDLWSKGKKYVLTGIKPWADKDGVVLGKKATVGIKSDGAPYVLSEKEEGFSMAFQSVVFNCKKITAKIGDDVFPVGMNPSVWISKNGDFTSLEVSFKCDDLVKDTK